MRRIIAIPIALCFLACSKSHDTFHSIPEKVYVYIKEIDTDGSVSKTEVLTTYVTQADGYFNYNFDVATASNVNRYDIMASSDGITFTVAFSIPGPLVHPNNPYTGKVSTNFLYIP